MWIYWESFIVSWVNPIHCLNLDPLCMEKLWFLKSHISWLMTGFQFMLLIFHTSENFMANMSSIIYSARFTNSTNKPKQKPLLIMVLMVSYSVNHYMVTMCQNFSVWWPQDKWLVVSKLSYHTIHGNAMTKIQVEHTHASLFTMQLFLTVAIIAGFRAFLIIFSGVH